jgi:hypothetical protein
VESHSDFELPFSFELRGLGFPPLSTILARVGMALSRLVTGWSRVENLQNTLIILGCHDVTTWTTLAAGGVGGKVRASNHLVVVVVVVLDPFASLLSSAPSLLRLRYGFATDVLTAPHFLPFAICHSPFAAQPTPNHVPCPCPRTPW